MISSTPQGPPHLPPLSSLASSPSPLIIPLSPFPIFLCSFFSVLSFSSSHSTFTSSSAPSPLPALLFSPLFTSSHFSLFFVTLSTSFSPPPLLFFLSYSSFPCLSHLLSHFLSTSFSHLILHFPFIFFPCFSLSSHIFFVFSS